MNYNILLVNFFFDEYVVSFPMFGLKSILSDIKMATPFAWNIFSRPFTHVMSILDIKVCFLNTAEGWILFFNPFYCLSSSWEIKTIDVKRYQWAMFADSCYFVVVVAVVERERKKVFPLLIFFLWDYLFLVFFWVWLIFLNWSFCSRVFCRPGLVNSYFWNLVLSWNVLFSPSSMIECFAGYHIQG